MLTQTPYLAVHMASSLVLNFTAATSLGCKGISAIRFCQIFLAHWCRDGHVFVTFVPLRGLRAIRW